MAIEKPPLLSTRPQAVQLVLAGVVPLVFGFVTGALLDISETLYIALNVLAAIGGVLGGLEHSSPRDATRRGAFGGLLFGSGLLLGNEVAAPGSGLIPDPPIVLAVFTTPIGAGLGALGGKLRDRV